MSLDAQTAAVRPDGDEDSPSEPPYVIMVVVRDWCIVYILSEGDPPARLAVEKSLPKAETELPRLGFKSSRLKRPHGC